LYAQIFKGESKDNGFDLVLDGKYSDKILEGPIFQLSEIFSVLFCKTYIRATLFVSAVWPFSIKENRNWSGGSLHYETLLIRAFTSTVPDFKVFIENNFDLMMKLSTFSLNYCSKLIKTSKSKGTYEKFYLKGLLCRDLDQKYMEVCYSTVKLHNYKKQCFYVIIYIFTFKKNILHTVYYYLIFFKNIFLLL